MDNIMTVRLHEVGKVSASVKDAVVVEKDVPGVGVPPGGASGQVLTKLSGADYDTGWRAAIGGGENDHGKLTNRDAQDQHPIGAIAGLAEALAGKQPKGDYLTADKLQSATDAALAQAKASGAFDGAPGKDAATDISLGLTGAQVGQIAKITAVDETGKPTAWAPANLPSGGVSYKEWEDWTTITVPEGGLTAFDISALESGEKLADKNVKEVFIFSPLIPNSGAEAGKATLTINDIFTFHLNTFTRSDTGMMKLWISLEDRHLNIRYVKRDTEWNVALPNGNFFFNRTDGDFISPITSGGMIVGSVGVGNPPIVVQKINSVKIQCPTGVNSGVSFKVKIMEF